MAANQNPLAGYAANVAKIRGEHFGELTHNSNLNTTRESMLSLHAQVVDIQMDQNLANDMFYPPRTIQEAWNYRYRKWSGSPNGTAFSPNCCAYEVYDSGRGCLPHQCRNKPGNGPDLLYCKIHAPKAQKQITTAQ